MTEKELYKKAKESYERRYPDGLDMYKDAQIDGYIAGATEMKDEYVNVIKTLVDELYTSRMYHLGITGLDSDAEIEKKEKEGNTALIRGIDRTIEYAKEVLEDKFDPRYIPTKESQYTNISEGMPTEDGEYVVIIGVNDMEYKEFCSYSKTRKKFRYWDYYDDKEKLYGKKDVKAWMKV